MGHRFRKSWNLGPLRLTLSKSGLGASIGVKGLRVTKMANGRTRTTVSLPGTGLSYVKESGGGMAHSGTKTAARPAKRLPSVGWAWFLFGLCGLVTLGLLRSLIAGLTGKAFAGELPLLLLAIGSIALFVFLTWLAWGKVKKAKAAHEVVSESVSDFNTKP